MEENDQRRYYTVYTVRQLQRESVVAKVLLLSYAMQRRQVPARLRHVMTRR